VNRAGIVTAALLLAAVPAVAQPKLPAYFKLPPQGSGATGS
jgi:hypothetical protein